VLIHVFISNTPFSNFQSLSQDRFHSSLPLKIKNKKIPLFFGSDNEIYYCCIEFHEVNLVTVNARGKARICTIMKLALTF
jgi:hypothetical protein